MVNLTERQNSGDFMIKGKKLYLAYSIIAFVLFLLGLDNILIEKVLARNTQSMIILGISLLVSVGLFIRYLVGKKRNEK